MNCRRGWYSFIFLLIGFARVVFAEIILSGDETPLVTAVPGHQSNPTFWLIRVEAIVTASLIDVG